MRLINLFSSPFIEERLYFLPWGVIHHRTHMSSRPLLSRSGCISKMGHGKLWRQYMFSSPFIEERLYLKGTIVGYLSTRDVLVPFYRGAVVFTLTIYITICKGMFSSPFIEERLYLLMFGIVSLQQWLFSSPFIEERLYLTTVAEDINENLLFSSPFIEERLYLHKNRILEQEKMKSSRPLLSRSGCIYDENNHGIAFHEWFSSPFIEERLYFVFFMVFMSRSTSSRPLLSRSGCI